MRRINPLLILALATCLSGCIYCGRGVYYLAPEYEQPSTPEWMNQLTPNPPKPKLVWKGHYYSFEEAELKREEEAKSRAPIQNPVRTRLSKKKTEDTADE